MNWVFIRDTIWPKQFTAHFWNLAHWKMDSSFVVLRNIAYTFNIWASIVIKLKQVCWLSCYVKCVFCLNKLSWAVKGIICSLISCIETCHTDLTYEQVSGGNRCVDWFTMLNVCFDLNWLSSNITHLVLMNWVELTLRENIFTLIKLLITSIFSCNLLQLWIANKNKNLDHYLVNNAMYCEWIMKTNTTRLNDTELRTQKFIYLTHFHYKNRPFF